MSMLEVYNEIKHEGKDFDFVPMFSASGERVLAAEVVICKLPIMSGLFIIEEVNWDICEVSQDYPISSLLRNRMDKEGRKVALSKEVYNYELEKAEADRKDDLKRDMLDYWNHVTGLRIAVGG